MKHSNKPQKPAGTAAKSPVAAGTPPIAPGQAPGEEGEGLPLPHERDESAGDSGMTPRPVMEQARRDLASGQVDTDLRGTPGLDAAGREDAVGPDAAAAKP
ncbi:hypothetical protein [Rubrivivax gelatinosus]|uniref:Uncharacterized protein n=1 Tax=Rubrivivax gelatinosus (strain NBRC 100245 / IL144) TaxID=983917 RepID=I0HSK2_RUBGI|nr:hypothetical protein [Rubrivivax gelatinosus]BAL95989.1 hypothetical protein RGE_26500 [Rubrivivax gelatinosus IL144]